MHTRRVLDNDSYMSRGANKTARSAVRSLKCAADTVKEKHNLLLVEEDLKTRTHSLSGVRSIYSNGLAGGCKQRPLGKQHDFESKHFLFFLPRFHKYYD